MEIGSEMIICYAKASFKNGLLLALSNENFLFNQNGVYITQNGAFLLGEGAVSVPDMRSLGRGLHAFAL